MAAALAAAPVAKAGAGLADRTLAFASKTLSTDIAVMRYSFAIGPRKRSKPLDVEIHVNGVGLIAVGVAGIAATVAWNGLTTGGLGGNAFGSRSPVQVFPGLKETGWAQRAGQPPPGGGPPQPPGLIDFFRSWLLGPFG